jgi:outer membrane protein assembly factor BamB
VTGWICRRDIKWNQRMLAVRMNTEGRGGGWAQRARQIGVVPVWAAWAWALVIPPIAASTAIADPPQSSITTEPSWPHRRGPHYNAISDETGLADSWPEEGPPLLWATELGQGYSGFTAAENRVYTQTQTLYSQYVLCLDADTGETVWKYRYGMPYLASGMYPGPRATPTLHNGRVYFAAPDGLVGCLDDSDGNLVWSMNVIEKFQGKGSDFGYACSPTVVDGKVILPVGGKGASVVALDADDGSTVWASGDEPASYCSAIPITLHDRRQVVAFLRNTLASFDLNTGRLLWEHRFSQGYDEHAAAPLYQEPYLVIALPWRYGAKAYRLQIEEATPLGDGPESFAADLIWDSDELSNDVASGLVHNGYIYGFDLREVQAKPRRPSRGEFKCIELATGEVRWSSDRPGHATVIAADGKLILFNDRGELILARISAQGYEELARTQVFDDEISWTAPALHQGRLYLRTPSRAVCLYLGTPENLGLQQRAAASSVAQIPKLRRSGVERFLGGVREEPFEPPTPNELCGWYLACLLGVFGLSALVTVGALLVARYIRPNSARFIGHATFWSLAFGLGFLGTPVLNRVWGQFVFTWPAFLFSAYQVTLIAIVWAEGREDKRRARWVSRVAGLALVVLCLAYFHACRTVAMHNESVFLVGFLPAFPVALLAARQFGGKASPLRELLWVVVSFSFYFWTCGVIVWTRS